MTFRFNDGGRLEAGYKGTARDCVARALSIATGINYSIIYSELSEANKSFCGKKSARNGLNKKAYEPIFQKYGFKWNKAPIFAGRKARCNDLTGIVIAKQAHHVVAVIDGMPNDIWDSSEKMVYGYWAK